MSLPTKANNQELYFFLQGLQQSSLGCLFCPQVRERGYIKGLLLRLKAIHSIIESKSLLQALEVGCGSAHHKLLEIGVKLLMLLGRGLPRATFPLWDLTTFLQAKPLLPDSLKSGEWSSALKFWGLLKRENSPHLISIGRGKSRLGYRIGRGYLSQSASDPSLWRRRSLHW